MNLVLVARVSGKSVAWIPHLHLVSTLKLSIRVRKILNLRVFEDENGKHWSKSVMDKQYEVLCVSQFTLQCVLKGNKPDFHLAMPTEQAESFYNSFPDQMRKSYRPELIKGIWKRGKQIVVVSPPRTMTKWDNRFVHFDGLSSPATPFLEVKVIQGQACSGTPFKYHLPGGALFTFLKSAPAFHPLPHLVPAHLPRLSSSLYCDPCTPVSWPTGICVPKVWGFCLVYCISPVFTTVLGTQKEAST